MRSVFGLALAFLTAAEGATSSGATPRASLPRPASICSAVAGDLPVSGARLLDFGSYRAPLVSRDSQAQRFFEQGLVFGWGFNFPEAVRSFRAAAQRDPSCALCRWGIAWALGPSINHDMPQADRPVALDAVVQARAYAEPRSRERALIDALATRYAGDVDQAAGAYADAMRALADRYREDADVAVLAAEAIMNAHAYDYWDSGGRARAWTPHIIALLERALRVAPEHPGAHHYQIHLFEESPQPERALRSAEKLGTMAPIVGHLVHMPSHIFFRLGRYRDAMQANAAAVQADREYSVVAGVESDYAIHNLHFLWAAALWSGDGAAASHAAQQLATAAATLTDQGLRQHLMATPMLTQVRLAQWDALAAPTDAAASGSTSGPYLEGLTQFARGMGHAARGDVRAARAQLDLLRRSYRITQKTALRIKNIHLASDVLNVARWQLQSAVAGTRVSEAVRHARMAVRTEDRLVADDPPVWPLPSRHVLGAALLKAGAAVEAAAVYRADLRRHPNNPVALTGLAAAERRLPLSLIPDSLSALRFAPSFE